MLINLLLMLPLLLSRNQLLNIYPVFTLAAIGPLFMYMSAMGIRNVPLLRRLFNLLMLVLLGMGLSLNNSRAVGEALIGVHSPFKRTPKYNYHNRQNAGVTLDYLLPKDGGVWIEALLGIYAFGLLFVAFDHGNWGLAFWLMLISGGYAYVAITSFKQSFEGKSRKTGGEVVRVSMPAAAPNLRGE